MGRGWGKLPFTSLSGERGGLYIRHGRCDISGQPASASVFASLDFLQAAATSPLQTLPEASEQERAITRAPGLCPALAEWKAAHRSRAAACDDAALQAALELGGYALRLPPASRRGRQRLHVPVDTQLPRGLLSSLGAADPATGKPRDFFAWLASVGKGAASSGRLQLFMLTHRGATFAVMADGRDRANPTLHLFDPLGSTLHATNQRAYAITFVASRRSGLEFNERPPAEQAADFFYRRFRHTLKVDKAVVDALASALENSPEAGAAALKAAVRRHAIVDVQEVLPAAPAARQAGDPAAAQLSAQLALLTNPKTSMEAIYESLVAPQGGSAPSTPKRGARLVRFNTSPPGALPPRARPPASPLARANSTPQPWGREPKQRSGGAAAAVGTAAAATGPPPLPLRRSSQALDVASPAAPASPAGASRREVAPAGSPLAGRRSASGALSGSPALASCLRASSSPIDRTPPASPQRMKQPQPGGGAGAGVAPAPHQDRHRRNHSASSVAGSSCVSPRSHAIGSRCRRANSEALLFKDADEQVWPIAPRALPPTAPAVPYSPPMARRKGAIASSLRRTASAIGTDLEAESRGGRTKRRAASIDLVSEVNKVPDSLNCKRDAAKLQAAVAKAVGNPSSGLAHQFDTQLSGTPPEPAGSLPAVGAPAAKAAASPVTSSPSTTSVNTFARMSDSSGGAGSDSSSARRSSHSDGANAASNGKGSASSMSTDSAYNQASPESLRSKFRGRASSTIGKAKPRGSSGKLSSIPEPALPQQPARKFGSLFAGFKTVLRWT